jgi:type II secretory pathway pseudopilin PulG
MRRTVATQPHTISNAKKPSRTYLSFAERPRRRRGGFLLVELLIGLVIVALVMLGAAAIMGAVAQGWNDQDVTRSTQVQANQTYLRVQSALQGAKYVCYYAPGDVNGNSVQPGCIFFWQNYNLQSGTILDPYLGEMALIQYDPTTQTLWLYHNRSPSQLDPNQMQELTSQSNFAAIASQFPQKSFVQSQALGGPGNQPNDGTRLQVKGFQVYPNPYWPSGASTQLPVVEFAIGFKQNDGTSLTLYNSTTIRGPATQPQ